MPFSEHWTDEDGNPAGGITDGIGFTISWQNGPLGRGASRLEPNGAFVEDVLRAVRGRLAFYQNSEFSCEENAQACDLIEDAIEVLCQRTSDREARAVEGTHAI